MLYEIGLSNEKDNIWKALYQSMCRLLYYYVIMNFKLKGIFTACLSGR